MNNSYYVVYFPERKEFLSEWVGDSMASSPSEAMQIRSLEGAKKLGSSFQYNSFGDQFVVLKTTKVAEHEFEMEQIYHSPSSRDTLLNNQE